MPIREINSQDVKSTSLLEVLIAGPGGHNRLFIYTGIATVNFGGDGANTLQKLDLAKGDGIAINLTKAHQPTRHYKPGTFAIAPVAYLASLKGSDDADDMTWAIDELRHDLANLTPSRDGELRLLASVAVQGENCWFFKLAYQVNVTTRVIRVTNVRFDPPPAPGQTVSRQLSGNNVGLFVDISDPAPPAFDLVIETDPPGVLPFPQVMTVPVGQTTLTVPAVVPPRFQATPQRPEVVVNVTVFPQAGDRAADGKSAPIVIGGR